VRVAGREYRDGVRNLEVMLESLSGGRRREIQEDGIVMEVKIFYLSVWDKCIWSADNVYLAQVKLILS